MTNHPTDPGEQERRAVAAAAAAARPDTLAIIVTWNKADVLDTMLTSLRASSPAGLFDVLVVDNASSDHTAALLAEKHPWVEVLTMPENMGGTGGFNAGMREGLRRGYDYLWLMDNDINVHTGCYERLRETMDADRRVALVGPQVLYLEEPTRTQEIGGRIVWKTGALLQVDKDEVSPSPRVNDVDYCSACCLFARAAAVREVGIWDPGYFITFDDVDWCVRMKRHGWKVVATSEAKVEHASFFGRRPRQTLVSSYYSIRNCLYFYRRNGRLRTNLPLMYELFRSLTGDKWLFRDASERAQATALGHAFSDYFGRRMGRCGHTIAFPKKEEGEEKPTWPAFGEKRATGRPVRVLVVGAVGKPFIEEQRARIRREYKNVQIDVFVNDGEAELVAAGIEGAKVVPFKTALQRLAWLPRVAAGRYDLVVAASMVRRFVFEDMIPFALRLDADHEPASVKRGGVARALGKLIVRGTAAAVAAPMAVAGALWPLGRPDYFTFDDVDGAASGSPRRGGGEAAAGEGEGEARKGRGVLGYAKGVINLAIALAATAVVTPIFAVASRWERRKSARRRAARHSGNEAAV
jgi:GT2 family glycosyltransferase